MLKLIGACAVVYIAFALGIAQMAFAVLASISLYFAAVVI